MIRKLTRKIHESSTRHTKRDIRKSSEKAGEKPLGNIDWSIPRGSANPIGECRRDLFRSEQHDLVAERTLESIENGAKSA